MHRANIFRETGDVTLAIVNFSQAIKLDPNDYEAYYQRAQMYEKVSKRAQFCKNTFVNLYVKVKIKNCLHTVTGKFSLTISLMTV